MLRVDSGGGSAFASDVILRELERFQETDRPVVVSMGSVAASGGYWIAMAADEIWASPTTLTGSIGVGATIPTIPRTLDWFGVHVDGIGTTELAGALDITRPLGESMKGLIELSVRNTYDDFIGKVAAASRAPRRGDRCRRARARLDRQPTRSTRGLVDELGDVAGRDRVGGGARRASRAALTCSITSSSSSGSPSAWCCR